jgi:hypothetical protein
MYPTFASPAALTVAAMMSDEAVASAERRRAATLALEARRARDRRDARRAAHAGAWRWAVAGALPAGRPGHPRRPWRRAVVAGGDAQAGTA